MLQLILTVLSIALMAGLALATVSYTPTWAPTAQKSFVQVQSGFQKLENAFSLRVSQSGGATPSVDPVREDGGLAPTFLPFLTFLPRAPAGYAWKYGFTSESQLLADGYAGNPAGGLHWFCLYTSGMGASEGVYRGVRRAQQYFGLSQYYANISGAAACGRAMDTGTPSAFPAPVSVTLFVRYVAANP